MPTCGNCGETGHNRKTCSKPVDAEKLARFEKKRLAKKPKITLTPTTAVKICSMGADGTFEVAVKTDADIDELTIVIAADRDIARRTIALFVAGDENALAGTQPVVGLMLDANATELFMLQRAINDRQVLEDIYNNTDGPNWQTWKGGLTFLGAPLGAGRPNATWADHNWMTDKPLSEWHGVTADAFGSVTELDLGMNDKITSGCSSFRQPTNRLPNTSRVLLQLCQPPSRTSRH